MDASAVRGACAGGEAMMRSRDPNSSRFRLDLRRAIEQSWDETTAAPGQWDPVNPAKGQCAVTALVVQDYLGGRLLRSVMVENQTSHYWNELPYGRDIDWTIQQFENHTVQTSFTRERSYLFSHPDTVARYEILKTRVAESLR